MHIQGLNIKKIEKKKIGKNNNLDFLREVIFFYQLNVYRGKGYLLYTTYEEEGKRNGENYYKRTLLVPVI